jgi:hypothetical protein
MKPAGPARRKAKRRRRFPANVLSIFRNSRMIGIRAGTEPHRFTGIWFVLVDDRVFVRPWNDEPGGWHRAFGREPRGTVAVSQREVAVRARKVAGNRLLDAIDSAYAEKYDTKASQKWVRGLATPRRRKTTTELLPG